MQDNFENSEIYELIAKQLSGEITVQEELNLNAWLNADETNQKTFEEFQQSWKMTEGVDGLLDIDLDKEWLRMETVISEDTNDSNLDEPKIISHTQFEQKGNFNTFYRVAAAILVLLIPAGLGYFYFSGGEEQIVAQTKIIEETLPDGSEISLFRNSKISYPKNFSKNKRTLKLEGEAFFNVVPNKQSPFVIDAGEVNIKVLGTSFNVNANKDQDWIEIVVESGIVLVQTNSKPKQEVELTAGEKGIYNRKSKKLNEAVNEDLNFNSWRTKKLRFQNKKLSQVIKTLNKVYKSNIIIKDKALKKCRIAIDFEDQSLEDALEVLQSIVDFDLSEENGTLLISGKGC